MIEWIIAVVGKGTAHGEKEYECPRCKCSFSFCKLIYATIVKLPCKIISTNFMFYVKKIELNFISRLLSYGVVTKLVFYFYKRVHSIIVFAVFMNFYIDFAFADLSPKISILFISLSLLLNNDYV
jgi:hypothetical protein